ncbi:unnamed protein product [Ranitomeya imitator]|uniref:Tc1-like transposase DDE domain-containing protein n=1 Tax=Ranitomeya imitator TaxID=111125 RepID=A0ABN9L1F0_9NEOB|nr:unnamed protein product [Ranitomeya imitator]
MDLINISEFDSSHDLLLPPFMSHIDVDKSVHRHEERHRKIREQLPRQPNYSMRSELKRLKTHWAQDPLSGCSPKELASAGFYKTGLENSCQCFCCGLVLCRLSISPTPLERHKKFNPSCAFIQGKDAGNIPIYDIRVQPKEIDPIDVKVSMENEQTRLQSFTCWPVYASIKPCELAETGFFFTGTGKMVKIDVKMDGAKYRTILEENLLESAKDLRLGQKFVFQQENDPKHKAKSTMEWVTNKRIQELEWPSQSPVLNPIENLWKELKTAVHKRSPSNLTELELFAKEVWARISVFRCTKLIETYHKRLAAVIEEKGGATKY